MGKFDIEISNYLATKQHVAKTLIKEADKESIIEALRIWLVKNVGCFKIVGDHFGTVNLACWFDYDTLVEEFDELLLSYRDWLNLTCGLVTTNEYNLLRYIRPDSFICFIGDIPDDLIPPPLDIEDDYSDHDIDEVMGFIHSFEQRLEDDVGHKFKVKQFMNDVLNVTHLPDIIRKYLI